MRSSVYLMDKEYQSTATSLYLLFTIMGYQYIQHSTKFQRQQEDVKSMVHLVTAQTVHIHVHTGTHLVIQRGSLLLAHRDVNISYSTTTELYALYWLHSTQIMSRRRVYSAVTENKIMHTGAVTSISDRKNI